MNDTSKYLSLFVREASEHAEQLGRHFPSLLSSGFQPELVEELHRHAHSLRGMAAAMGFDEIGELARGVEGLLARMRGRPAALDARLGHALGDANSLLLGMIRARTAGSVVLGDPSLVASLDGALPEGDPPSSAAP